LRSLCEFWRILFIEVGPSIRHYKVRGIDVVCVCYQPRTCGKEPPIPHHLASFIIYLPSPWWVTKTKKRATKDDTFFPLGGQLAKVVGPADQVVNHHPKRGEWSVRHDYLAWWLYASRLNGDTNTQSPLGIDLPPIPSPHTFKAFIHSYISSFVMTRQD